MLDAEKKRIFITGSAGFIGFHTAKSLLQKGHLIHGFDNLSNYYDKSLKERRHEFLEINYNQKFSRTIASLEDAKSLESAIKKFNPQIIIHLAAQAGVRYSLEHPEAYIESNIVGTFNLLEIIKNINIEHFLMASTSSVYGSNLIMPFEENHKSDEQLTIYSATKKSNESMIHAYSYIYKIPSTIFRFFTVYGPWGRPDMALFKFTKGIINEEPIDVYNNGDMFRDFTYVDDLVESIRLLTNCIPSKNIDDSVEFDSKSNSAPFRIVNIGNSEQVNLMDFINLIEKKLNKKAILNYMPMQTGDIKSTLADNKLLFNLTGYKPRVSVEEGVSNFVDWYIDHYEYKKWIL